MLANSLADVVAEEAAKRLLPDVNLEREATKAERIGVGVAKRLALVQADIWAERGEAGEICELDPLLEEEEVCTRSAIGRLVDELAHQGHLLARHNNGLQCKACNVYRADRQFKFLEQNHLVSLGHVRPTSSPVSHQERKPTRPQSIRFAASLFFSTVSSRLTSTPQSVWTSDLQTTLHCPPVCRTCRDKFRNLVVHFLQANLLCFLSHTMCMTCGRKSLLITQTDPELRCSPILTTEMDGTPPSLQVISSPFAQVLSARLAKYIAWTLLLAAQS